MTSLRWVVVARWEPDAKGRLRRAALELFADGGFEPTTVAEIAGPAGVTERTFFRHFADKREVLFSGQHELRDAFVAAVEGAGPDATPDELARRRAGRSGIVVLVRPPGARSASTGRDRRQPRPVRARAPQAGRARGGPRRRAAWARTLGNSGEPHRRDDIAVFKVAFAQWLVDPDDRSLVAIQHDLLATTHTIAAAG